VKTKADFSYFLNLYACLELAFTLDITKITVNPYGQNCAHS